MRVIIADDNESWRKWGELVEAWIRGKKPRPKSTSELAAVMASEGIGGSVPGLDRPVEFVDYPNDGILYIPLPSEKMLDAKLAKLKPGPYPFELMPHFYCVAYPGAARAKLSADEGRAFALRRIGEYTVNECC